jgi:uncharacterized protein YoxC
MLNAQEPSLLAAKEMGGTQNSNNNLSHLVSDSRAAIILQRLQDSVSRNENEIKLLQNLQNSWLTKISQDIDTLRDRLLVMEDQISFCKKKSGSIDEAVRIPGTPDMTIGEGVAANRRALAKTLNLIANKAESEDVEKRTTQLQHDFNQKIEKMTAHVTVVEKLNQAVLALGNRLDVLSLDVQNKVDRSMLTTLTSEAELVRNYSTFADGAEKSIQSLQTISDKLQKDFNNQMDSVKILSDRTTDIQSVITLKPNIDDLRSLREDICSMLLSYENKTCEKMLQLEQKQLQSDANINSVEKDTQTLYSAHETLAKHVTKRFDETYKKTHVDHLLEKYLLVDGFLDAIQQVVHDVESKASEASVQVLETMVNNVKEEHELTKKKADLAARFIDWYTRNFPLENSPCC